MPMFEYKCKNCGKIYEELVFSWDENPDITCPCCSSEESEKLFSVPATVAMSSRNSSSECECAASSGSGFS